MSDWIDGGLPDPNDIVERLKDCETATHALFGYIFHDARKEIERLSAELSELRAKAEAQAVPVEIEDYLNSYEWRSEDNGVFELTNRDRELLRDFVNGLPLYTAPPAQAVKKSAKQRFDECGATEECDPIERLRFFCSLAMNPQDWLDVEPFFDALRAQAEPVAYGLPNTAITGRELTLMMVALEVPSNDQYSGALWVPLYTAPPAQAVSVPDVDWLANVIREADGNNSLGAGQLAEKIIQAMEQPK